MAIKINIGINKKLGQPNFGSRGASCNVEFELDGSFDNGGAARFQEAVRKAYVACREAVEAELSASNGNAISADASNGRGGQHSSPGQYAGNGNDHPAGANETTIRRATASQVRAIHAIANRNRVDLNSLLMKQYRVDRPENLSIGDASSLIDQLKDPTTGTGADTGNGVRQ